MGIKTWPSSENTPPSSSSSSTLLQSRRMGDYTMHVRCPSQTLTRIQSLNPAEVISLFTPAVPHPSGTTLARNMDPFEPLGRALRRQVRHVPYRLDHGMTETHESFLSASGAIVLVICAPDNVLACNPEAFELQLDFCQCLVECVEDQGSSMKDVPIVLLLVSDGRERECHLEALKDFEFVVQIDGYGPDQLIETVESLLEFE